MENGDHKLDDKEVKTPRRKWAAERWADTGFLNRWQREHQLGNPDKPEEDEDDDDEESSGGMPFKNRKRLGSGVLKFLSDKKREPENKKSSILDVESKPDTDKDKIEEPVEADAAEVVELSGSEAAPEDLGSEGEPTSPEEPDAPIEADTEEPDEASGTTDLAVPETTEPALPEAEAEDEDDTSATTPVAPGGSGGSAGGGSGSGSGSGGAGGGSRRSGAGGGGGSGGRGVPPIPPIGGGGGWGAPGGGPVGPNVLAGPITPNVLTAPVVHERIIERRNGRLAALALLATGAEYIGRRRAVNRLEKTDAKLAKKNALLKKEVDRLAQEKSKESAQVAAKQRQVERRLDERQKTQEVLTQVRRPEVQASTIREKQAEKSPSPKPFVIERTSADRTKEVLSPVEAAAVAETIRPATIERTEFNTVYQRTPEASVEIKEAIVDKPIERLYELRHEAKDDDAAAAAAHAASVGAILAHQRGATALQAAAASEVAKRLTDKQLQQSDPDMYKQAMARGLWGALIIIIFGTIVYLVAH